MLAERYDVVVVGAGNAALCAALTALDRGARVLVLERTPESERGGNSRFTAGGMRFAYDGPDDISELIPDLTEQEKATTDFGSYPESEFFSDLARITNYRADPDLAHLLVSKSREAVFWLRDHAGVRFLPSYRRFAFLHNGRHTFWGGVAVESTGGGPGLVEAETDTYLNAGGRAEYEARAVELLYDGGRVKGVRVQQRRLLPRRGGGVGGARRRGLPGKSGLADAVSGPGVRPGPGQGHMGQHRRRHPHGPRHRRRCVRALVRRPRRPVGPQRSRVRRSSGWRRLLEAQLSARCHGERERRSIRRRGCRLSDVHLCQVRPRRDPSAGSGGVADLRRQGDRHAPRRIPHPAGDPGPGRDTPGARSQDGGRRPRPSPRRP